MGKLSASCANQRSGKRHSTNRIQLGWLPNHADLALRRTPCRQIHPTGSSAE